MGLNNSKNWLKLYYKILGVFLLLFGEIIIFSWICVNARNDTNAYYTTIKLKMEKLNDDDLYQIWNETPFKTSVNNLAHEELDRRGYWIEMNKVDEKKCVEIFNNFINNK